MVENPTDAMVIAMDDYNTEHHNIDNKIFIERKQELYEPVEKSTKIQELPIEDPQPPYEGDDLLDHLVYPEPDPSCIGNSLICKLACKTSKP